MWLQSNLSLLWDGPILREGIEAVNETALEVIKLQIYLESKRLILQNIQIIYKFLHKIMAKPPDFSQ